MAGSLQVASNCLDWQLEDDMTPQERKAKIKQLNDEARDKRHESFDLAQACPHKILEQQPDEHGYGFAECEGCDTQFGWYCPDSPDRVCHYHTDEGKVELIDGTLVDMPANHDSEHESSDWCLYCGHPDERK
jgi:hypothetical protein